MAPYWTSLIQVAEFQGVKNFYDLTPVFCDSQGMRSLTSDMGRKLAEHNCQVRDKEKGIEINKIVTTEARGFILGGALAFQLLLGIALVRKEGKLPGEVLRENATIEYGERTFEMRGDLIQKDEHVVIVDDVLATGETLLAAARLVERAGGVVSKIMTAIEISNLNGSGKLRKAGYDYESLHIVTNNDD